MTLLVTTIDDNEFAVEVEASPEAVRLIVEDARRHGAESFYVRVPAVDVETGEPTEVPVHFATDAGWEVRDG